MAYIDPGTGSLLIQALIAGLLGFLFTIRKWVQATLRRLFNRKSGSIGEGKGE